MRPDSLFSPTRRDAPLATLNRISRAAALISRDPIGALQRAQAEHPYDRELIESIEQRAVVVPTSAATVTAFSQTAVSDLGGVIGPMSGFAQVTGRALGVDLDGPNAGVLVPHLIAAADTATFIAPGSPIPVKNFSLSGPTLSPHKVACIVALTREAAEGGNAERLFRALLTENVALSVDKMFFDSVETDGSRPSGARFGVNATLSADDMIEDLTVLASIAAMRASSMDDIVFVASPDIAVKIMLALPNLKIPVIASSGIEQATVLALACNALAVAASPEIRFDVSDQAVLHMEDETPTELSTVGTPNVVSAPNRSLWQTDSKALRLIFEIDWKWRASDSIGWMTSISW